jgi:hypothetical protein
MQDPGARRGSVSIVQEPGCASGPVWMVPENLAPPLGFETWTVQPVASRCTHYALSAKS